MGHIGSHMDITSGRCGHQANHGLISLPPAPIARRQRNDIQRQVSRLLSGLLYPVTITQAKAQITSSGNRQRGCWI
jgi:hypothetical protein